MKREKVDSIIELSTAKSTNYVSLLLALHVEFFPRFASPYHSNMDKIKFNYSLKNIPIPFRKAYIQALLEKLESFIKRLRWKAFFLDTNDEPAEYNNKTFCFKSEATPTQHDGLKYFEQDLYEMVRRIQFRPVKSSFQSQLLADVKTIRNSTSVIVPADKTTNLYRMSVADYSKLLNDNIFC